MLQRPSRRGRRRDSTADRDGCTGRGKEHAEKATARAEAAAGRVCRGVKCAERLGTSTLPRQSAKQAWAIRLRIRRLVVGARLRKTQVSTRPMRWSADCVQSARGSTGRVRRCHACACGGGCRLAENRSAPCIAWTGGMARASGYCQMQIAINRARRVCPRWCVAGKGRARSSDECAYARWSSATAYHDRGPSMASIACRETADQAVDWLVLAQELRARAQSMLSQMQAGPASAEAQHCVGSGRANMCPQSFCLDNTCIFLSSFPGHRACC